jgi:putative ABC transport system permease protein
MLKLENIKKDYKVADMKVHALKGISLEFRKNEFVAVLGPSGCGKTTLLNIIGGLDKYTSGNLFINGRSTKDYKDRDWDVYRNHRIGFIFQSYNLIPHQTILENVELALTIAGIEKEERIRRAKEALDKVGLSDQYYKHPNQLSGGQCQRVAIARALVNEPEILLADEPTGALDTKTSVQIMNLLKEIANERLIIMVTHNPELAELYATRTIKLLDGNVLEDSNPYKEENEELEIKNMQKEKAKMSLWTAFKLSARNLKSKLKRTLMVCLASSIGIIGVSAVLAVSTGVKTFISDMQDDMLSGNPIVISESTIDLNALMSTMSASEKKDAVKKSIENGYVNVNSLVEYLVESGETMKNLQITNDINENYIKYLDNMPAEYYIAMSKDYGVNISNNIYTNIDFSGKDEQLTSISAITTIYTSLLKETEFKEYSGMVQSLGTPFSQSLANSDYILSQYDILSDKQKSKIASEYNEIMIVLTEDQELNDLILARLGYYSQEEFLNLVYKAVDNKELYNPQLDKERFSYDELINKTFMWYPNDEIYNMVDGANPETKYAPLFSYSPYASAEWENGIELKVTAILKPKENLNYGSLKSGFYYTPSFMEKVLENSINSQIVNFYKSNNMESITSVDIGMANGIYYNYSYQTSDTSEAKNSVGYIGNMDAMMSMMGSMSGNTNIPDMYELSLREIGGNDLPSRISIYPLDFDRKHLVTDYLDAWNGEKDIIIDGNSLSSKVRSEIKYTDTLELVINIMNSMIDIVTIALVAFTSLSLVVSTVMIAIIIYVSVIERIKEIGVIRSLGGRKKDVSHLFNAESVIIGASSGLIGVGITYALAAIVNAIVSSSGVVSRIAILPISYAIIIVVISTLLTSISGLVPASMAAKKDPVVALRSE